MSAEDATLGVGRDTAVGCPMDIHPELVVGEGWEDEGAVGQLVPEARHGGQGAAVLQGPVDGGLRAAPGRALQTTSRAVHEVHPAGGLRQEHRPLPVHQP